MDPSLQAFIQQQASNIGLPEQLVPSLLTKLANNVEDSQDVFDVDSNSKFSNAEHGLGCVAKTSITKFQDVFLIPCIWTTSYASMNQELAETPELRERLAKIVGVPGEKQKSLPLIVDHLSRQLWKHFLFLVASSEDSRSMEILLCCMSDFGLLIHVGDTPNVNVGVIVNPLSGSLVAVMWPIQDIASGTYLSRDLFYADSSNTKALRSSIVYAPEYINRRSFLAGFNQWKGLFASKVMELQPRIAAAQAHVAIETPTKSTWKIYVPVPAYRDNLKSDKFVFTDTPSEADIIWTGESLTSLSLRPDQYVNRFPYEGALVQKHQLASLLHHAYGFDTSIIPETFSLEDHLAPFIGRYYQLADNNQDNTWILKPVALALSMNTIVTDDLACIARYMETGSYVASKYISTPALMNQRKFDIRLLVAVKSMSPLQFHVASNDLYIRVSPEDYDLTNLHNTNVHLTVSTDDRASRYIYGLDDVTSAFLDQLPGANLQKILATVKTQLEQIFKAAAGRYDMQQPFARSIYGVDVMLTSHYDPKILEVTFLPNVAVATNANSQVVTELFEYLFS